ncbi:MAG: serine/threonine protein kinase [Myxococcales bacterium]|nr:serine/threonine protein kinase [Myxococcales bacterium]
MAQQPMVIGDRYEPVERIAEGGMAIVWKARVRGAAGFARTVAVKEIKVEYRQVRQYIQMFIEEARIGTELVHPHIVQVLDFVVEGDTHYLVFEWVDGLDLHHFVRAFSYLEQPILWPLAVAAGVGALQGLSAAHERVDTMGEVSPVVHRNVSPHNILINQSGTVKLSDFGLARARDRAFTLTNPGILKGKISYFAPEITLGMGASVLTEQFSMGCVLWEALVADRLFDGTSDVAVFTAIRSGEVKDLKKSRAELSGRVVDAVHRSLSLKTEHRFPSSRAFAAELSECLRELGGGLYDASERSAAAVQVARETLESFEPNAHISASQMNLATMSLQIDVESASFAASTQVMDAQDTPEDS